MTRLEAKIDRWLSAYLNTKLIVRLSLSAYGAKQAVWTHHVGPRLERTDVEGHVHDIARLAQEHAQAANVFSSFVLSAFVKGQRTAIAKLTFDIRPRRDTRITIRLPVALRTAIEDEAKDQRRSIANIIVFTLEDRFLKNHKGGK